MSERKDFSRWLLIAIGIRAIGAATRSSWAHPDEWYQTAEFAQFLARGFGSYSQEVTLHLRNMSWPMLLSLPLRIAHFADPTSVWLRVFLCQFFAGLIDLGVIWGWWQMSLSIGISRNWRNAGLALLILPWFSVQNSIRLATEHLSAAMFWIAVGSAATQRWRRAGFFAVAVAAFRYPSALLSLGFGVSLVAQGARDRTLYAIKKFATGAAVGVVIFGLPDFVVYGRPWESLWMYLQYNLLLGLGTKVFGTQSAVQYWGVLHGEWFRALWPAGVALCAAAPFGFAQGLRRMEPWALGPLFFILGHLAIGHKEPRFIVPLDALFLWSAFQGARILSGVFDKLSAARAFAGKWIGRVSLAFLLYIIVADGLMLVHSATGECLLQWETYLYVGHYLERDPAACAVITSRPLTSFIFPEFPIGLITPDGKLEWAEQEPRCAPKDNFLLNLGAPDPAWAVRGCELLPSGALALVPRPMWQSLLSLDLERGPWYRCPSSALLAFGETGVEHPYFKQIKRLPRLPPLGIAPDEFLAELRAAAPPPDCSYLCARTF